MEGCEDVFRVALIDTDTCSRLYGEFKEVLVNGTSKKNDDEARFIKLLVTMLIQANSNESSKTIRTKDIGILAAYAAQRDEIWKQMESTPFIEEGLQIETVDGYQGSEKGLIVFSATRSEDIGFLAQRGRINVSLTRAKRGLIVVGSKKNLKSDPELWGKWIEYMEARDAVFSVADVFDQLALNCDPPLVDRGDPRCGEPCRQHQVLNLDWKLHWFYDGSDVLYEQKKRRLRYDPLISPNLVEYRKDVDEAMRKKRAEEAQEQA